MVEHNVDLHEHLSSGEYTLSDGVYFVQGANRGAIYDINSGRVFSINDSACDILLGKQDNRDFWKSLEGLNLAVNKDTEIEYVIDETESTQSLQFVWYEIVSDDCNECCLHCYGECMPPTYRKRLNIPTEKEPTTEREAKQNNKLTFEKWKSTIDDAYKLGCRRCQFIGGEPFLYKGDKGQSVLDLAEYAKEMGYEFIEIYTNATMLTSQKVQKIKDLGLHIAVSLYSIDPEIHDFITQTPGSCKLTIRGLELLKKAEIPVRVETVLMKQNERTIKETQQFVEALGFEHKQPDVLRPRGRGDNPSLMPSKESIVQYALMNTPNFTVSQDMLHRNISGHSCLSGKLTITDSGDIIPCIFSRDMVVGNVNHDNLGDIINSNALTSIWGATKDKILVCQDCEYRYVCFDCRPLAKGANQERGEYLTAPYPRCTYNPYEGQWGKGVWRLDLDNKPTYQDINKKEKGGEQNESRNQ